MSPPIGVGLCSVALRHLDIDEVVDVAAASAVEGIEWGGDVHVPPADLAAADRARRACEARGLAIPSYGSYLGSGRDRDPVGVLDTAVALGATNVRVWAGARDGVDADSDERARVAERLAGWCELAAERGLTLSLERHGGTLTESTASAGRFLDEVDRPELWTYWQPLDHGRDPDEDDLADLDALAGRLSHLHVFWWHDALHRFPLADGEAFWAEALRRTAPATAWPHRRWAFIEFVRDDDPAQVMADGQALARLRSG